MKDNSPTTQYRGKTIKPKVCFPYVDFTAESIACEENQCRIDSKTIKTVTTSKTNHGGLLSG